MTKPALVGTVEAAAILGISVPAMKRLIRAGGIVAAHKFPGGNGAYVFERDHVVRIRDARIAAMRAELDTLEQLADDEDVAS